MDNLLADLYLITIIYSFMLTQTMSILFHRLWIATITIASLTLHISLLSIVLIVNQCTISWEQSRLLSIKFIKALPSSLLQLEVVYGFKICIIVIHAVVIIKRTSLRFVLVKLSLSFFIAVNMVIRTLVKSHIFYWNGCIAPAFTTLRPTPLFRRFTLLMILCLWSVWVKGLVSFMRL